MRKTGLLCIAIGAILAGKVFAESPETLEEAKALSARQGKPMLIEFFQEGCEYCELAAREVETEELVINALKSVVHIPINVEEGEGIKLSQEYKVGSHYPVFILTDNVGEIIYRWTGYTGARPFIVSLSKGLSDLTTVKDRIARFRSNPTRERAVQLGKYHSDIGEHLEAIEFYRQAQNLGAGSASDYSFEIFQNTANAAWKDMIPFNDVIPSADAVMEAKRSGNIVKMAKVMARLARKKDKTDKIARYLSAGIDVSANGRDKKTRESHELLRADYALYVDRDTAEAISIKKASLGAGWENDPEKYYGFAKWCLERKINLEEAEMHARNAGKRTRPGEFRGKVFNTVAEICFLRGNTKEALRLINLAIDQDPNNEKYYDQLERFQGGSGD